jgi:DNA-binding NtrC family response regulator
MKLETVLVVDDDPGMPTYVGRMLAPAKIVGTTDPLRAPEFARRMKPQLALVDHYMPLRTGLEMVSDLRRELCELVIGFMSGLLTIELSMEAIRAGATWFIEKVFDKAQLEAQVTKGGAPLRLLDSSTADFDYNLDRAYRRHIHSVLALADGNKSRAAAMLGIRRTSLQAILKRIHDTQSEAAETTESLK